MQAVQRQGYEQEAVLYMAMELSNSSWKLGFSNGQRTRRRSIEARDRFQLIEEVQLARQKLGLEPDTQVVVCFEAGRDGHWIYRWLSAEGFRVLEIDSSSIETPRGRKHVKTDRIDVEKLLDMLIRYCLGFRKAFRVVRVPSKEAEAEQRLHREDEYLIRQRARVSNRLKGLLVNQGIVEVPLKRGFEGWLEAAQTWDGSGLSEALKTEIRRLYVQYQLMNAQIAEVEQVYQQELLSDTAVADKRRQLERLKCIGPKTSRILSAEVFSWRVFSNGKQVGGMAGLTPTPSQSGDVSREQGISKAGNRRVRRVMIELAWFWLRWQPESHLSQWFNQRFAHGGKRMRRIGIVALARKLLIALWRYVEDGVIPKGAILKVA